MKFSAVTITLTSILLKINVCGAIPLLWSRNDSQLQHRQPQSYSVVPVDGGSPTASPVVAATKTVTDAVTQVQTTVLLSTVLATPQVTPASPQTVTLTQSASALTVQPSIAAIPFDDGQWHTTYYFKSTITPSTAAVLATLTSSSASTITPSANLALLAAVPSSPSSGLNPASVDLGQWAPWASKNGNWNSRK